MYQNQSIQLNETSHSRKVPSENPKVSKPFSSSFSKFLNKIKNFTIKVWPISLDADINNKMYQDIIKDLES